MSKPCITVGAISFAMCFLRDSPVLAVMPLNTSNGNVVTLNPLLGHYLPGRIVLPRLPWWLCLDVQGNQNSILENHMDKNMET